MVVLSLLEGAVTLFLGTLKTPNKVYLRGETISPKAMVKFHCDGRMCFA